MLGDDELDKRDLHEVVGDEHELRDSLGRSSKFGKSRSVGGPPLLSMVGEYVSEKKFQWQWQQGDAGTGTERAAGGASAGDKDQGLGQVSHQGGAPSGESASSASGHTHGPGVV